ncbi:MAG: SWF/SNF helicase family protein [Armatimonadetes bacterium]|nr:SWF/SNF helicase family protein [Armatimonadota bacterium]
MDCPCSRRAAQLRPVAYDNLHEYTRLRLSAAQSNTERYATEFVLKLLKRRLVSSPAAFSATLDQHLRSLRPTDRRGKATDLRRLRDQVDRTNEDFLDDDEQEDTLNDVADAATSALGALSAEEERLLRELKSWVSRARGRADSKAAKLIAWLNDTLKPKGQWNDQRVIVFSEFRATQEYLRLLLSQADLAEGTGEHARLLLLYGGMPLDRREAVKAAFQAGPDKAAVRLLLATDAASEGMNLQNHCHRVVHESVPYPPTRLEQRNGRVDRHGQHASEALIYHFVSAGYHERLREARSVTASALDADLEFLMRVAVKVNTIREDLGKVRSVIAEQVEEVSPVK